MVAGAVNGSNVGGLRGGGGKEEDVDTTIK
jgi:hypothetical protein